MKKINANSQTSREAQAKRRAKLSVIAQQLGYPNWGKFETAVIRGLKIIVKP